MSVKHQNKKALDIWAKEIAACGTGGTPGITAVVGGRPKASPCLKLFSFLYPKQKLDASVTIAGQTETYSAKSVDPEPEPEVEVKQPGGDSDRPAGIFYLKILFNRKFTEWQL